MHKQSEFKNGPMSELRPLWKWHQANMWENTINFNHPNLELQHNLPFQYWLWAKRVSNGRIPYDILGHKPVLKYNTNMALQTSQRNYSAELAFWTIKSKKTSYSRTSNTVSNLIKKTQSFPFEEERLTFHNSAKSRPSRVKITFSWLSSNRITYDGESHNEY